MSFENKVLGVEISQFVYEKGITLGTAESCTAGRIAEAIVSIPGASAYFKGSIISYTNEVKEQLLGVDRQQLEEKTAVCEEVAQALVKGARKARGVDYAVAATGVAGPTGGTPEIPVGTIWLAVGNADNIQTLMLSGDNGRDTNLEEATHRAMQLLIDYLHEHVTTNNNEQGFIPSMQL